jgi:hypothetical protein
VQLAAAKASIARRPTNGLRHRPFVEPADPPAHRMLDEVAS